LSEVFKRWRFVETSNGGLSSAASHNLLSQGPSREGVFETTRPFLKSLA
jgi:hypothetical protein